MYMNLRTNDFIYYIDILSDVLFLYKVIYVDDQQVTVLWNSFLTESKYKSTIRNRDLPLFKKINKKYINLIYGDNW